MPLQPASHSRDPVTSFEAEFNHTLSGKRQAHADTVLGSVRDHPSRTAEEYGERTGLGRVEAARRLSDLKNAGLVERRGRERFHGTSQSLWRLTESGERVAGGSS